MKKMLASLASLITLSLFIFSCSPQIPEVVEEAPQQIEDMVQPEVTAETVPIPATETPKEEVK